MAIEGAEVISRCLGARAFWMPSARPTIELTAARHRRSWLPPGLQPSCHQVIVLGMTRSGTSLTTSIVAGLLGGAERPTATWTGSARPYPMDRRTTAAGYFERQACTQHAAHSHARRTGTPCASPMRRTSSHSTTGCSRSWATPGRNSPPALRRGRRCSTGARRTRVRPGAGSSMRPPVFSTI